MATLKKAVSKLRKWIRNWFAEYNELLIVPASFLLFILSKPFFVWVDPTSGSYDIAILQSVVVGTFCVAWIWGVSWIMYRWSWPKLAKWLDDTMEKSLENPSENQYHDVFKMRKTLIGFGVYFLYVFSFTIILTAIL